jgi:hypothetical protein
MPSNLRNTRSGTQLATQASQLALAVPQVMAHRLTRMALGGSAPNERDQAEFKRMSAEKMTAFSQSFTAMALYALKVQQEMSWALARSMFSPWLGSAPTFASSMRDMQGAALGMATAGLSPVHRTATANARRLAGTPLRE